MWKPIAGYEGFYEVSISGKVRRVGKKTLKEQLSSHGYSQVTLCRQGKPKVFAIHTLVMNAFVGPRPKGKEVNHKNGNKRDPRLENLEYVTHAENSQHSRRVLKRNGGILKGEQNAIHKLTDEDVRFILSARMIRLYGHCASLARKFNVDRTLISRIIRRKSWKHINAE